MYFWVLQGLHFEELVTKICFGAKDVIHCVLMVLLIFQKKNWICEVPGEALSEPILKSLFFIDFLDHCSDVRSRSATWASVLLGSYDTS